MAEEPQALFGPVAADLSAVEDAIRAGIGGDAAEVAAPMADLFEAGGKRIRPALVLLSARCGRYDIERLMPAAIAVEMTHAATLVHDDVIDRAAVRRGRPTVAARLGQEAAIVIGDFYFAKAYEQAARTDSSEVVAILARTVMDICAGEVRQQAIRHRYSTGVDEYMRRIEAKTATLLAASCQIGALIGGLDAQKRSALSAYGRLLGLAFQIADDVLDYTASEPEIGKPIGHDIADGFATLPLMLAMTDAAVSDRLHQILADAHELDSDEAQEVVALVRKSSGPREALERARDHAQAAQQQLGAIESREVVDSLAALAGYVVSRKL